MNEGRYLLFDGNEIMVEGKRYRLRGFEDKDAVREILTDWDRPSHIGSTQVPLTYDVRDDEGIVCCVHDWMSDEEVRWKIKEGMWAREEVGHECRMEGRE